jgi:tRNA G18 (ribose-2'-O)-methylase SpoU
MRKLTASEMERISVEEFKTTEKSNLVLVLDNVRSMHNVGSVFRTGDAFLIEKLVLCGITGTPPHREIQKTALGATESVAWEHAENTLTALQKLREEGYKLIALEQTTSSISLQDFQPTAGERYALIFGNEVYGVQQEVIELVDACVEIPQFGTKHSFNISVSVGIILWDFFTKTR